MDTRPFSQITTIEHLTSTIIIHQSLTDPRFLHRQFVQLGRERNKITYKLLALLPQIYKSKIYEEKGYATIYKYAGKLAGLSHSIVEKALKLEDKLKDKPCLQKAIETQGIHKVSIIANLATMQTDAFFADKVENMSKPALQQWSKEIRMETQNWPKGREEKPAMKIELDDKMEFLFLKLKNKFGKNLSNKEALRKILQTLERDISGNISKVVKTKNKKNINLTFLSKNPREKFDENNKNIAKQQNNTQTQTAVYQNKQSLTLSRYIPATIKKSAIAKTDGKCAHEKCNKPYEILHHINRFALNKHNEFAHENIIPLCKEHHEFAHNGLLKEDAQNNAHEDKRFAIIDKKYLECRQQSKTS